MKNIIILSGLLCLFINAEAVAGVNVSVGLFGEPEPAYVEAPVYVGAPVYPTYAVEGEWYHRHHGHRDHRRDNHHR